MIDLSLIHIYIEVIVRQMMRKVKIDDGGDTGLITGANVDKSELLRVNAEIERKNAEDGGTRRPASGLPVLPVSYTHLVIGAVV